ncbi:FAD-dependent monooxygenase [Halomonas piscis]|uniref:Alkyl hydroperoxide reductase subunit F n=1 Tax=Halomonas piscis TaxID=3031727 RepID=A0ABY9YYZ5_9GAMM|nr:FAD-dependent monooxygenase [Halomonas piscis]WNK20071.1 FAD-dependent monooxygenase [Halomonas piscis]
MQFHHHGYVSGDPKIEPAAGVGIDRTKELPDKIDVLVIGAGPAGMITAAQLAQFPNVEARLIDSRPERLAVANADGIQARSVETFQAFGFANAVMDEAYRITEMAVWRPDDDQPDNIVRASVPEDDPSGISEFPHLILNQVRVQDHLVDFMANSPARMQPNYGIEFISMEDSREGEYPLNVRVRYTAGEREGEERILKVKYVVGCDGAHSRVRKAIGRKMEGKQAAHAWGVMDVLAVTDFPDIRTKSIIQSKSGGNILHIPREGGHLFRMYVDLGEVPTDDESQEVRKTTFEQTLAKANEIMHPYSLDVRHVARYTVYEIGHRLTDKFDDVEDTTSHTPKVMIAGDACHTHSAKAGQGMNVSLQDGFNLGWKLGHVTSGLAPASILNTYSEERKEVARNLIDFDQKWSRLMGTRGEDFEDPKELEEFYVKTWEFPAGFMTQYQPSMITGSTTYQGMASGFPIGKRFHSAPVVRVADATPVELGHLASADGRWRIYAFADENHKALQEWAHWMEQSEHSPLKLYTPEGVDANTVFDVKAIYPQTHDQIEVMDAPAVFKPLVGPFELVNLENIFSVDAKASDIFEKRGIDRTAGAVVVVRPDQYVAHVLPLAEPELLASFFEQCMYPQK